MLGTLTLELVPRANLTFSPDPSLAVHSFQASEVNLFWLWAGECSMA